MDMILFKVFFSEEHRLDSTTTDITTALFLLLIMSLCYLILWNQVDILQKHFKKDYIHMRLWTRFYGTLLASKVCNAGGYTNFGLYCLCILQFIIFVYYSVLLF